MYSRWPLIGILLALSCGRLGFDASETSDPTDAAVDPPIDAEMRVNLEFTAGAAVPEFKLDGFVHDDAVLTADLTELYFASNRPGGLDSSTDIYRVTRTSPTEPWGPIVNATPLSTTGGESTIAISGNGLFILFGSSLEDPRGDVYLSSRADRSDDFSSPRRLTEINSTANDSASWISDDGLTIWLHSERDDDDGGLDFDIYQSTRPDLSSGFSRPTRIAGLSNPAASEVSATFHGGFALFVISLGASSHDLYVARRIGDTMTFETPVALVGPNTASIETDPWLSPDGCTLFFARQVDGLEQVFEASCSSE